MASYTNLETSLKTLQIFKYRQNYKSIAHHFEITELVHELFWLHNLNYIKNMMAIIFRR